MLDAESHSTTQSAPLLRLPSELSNRIYGLVLTSFPSLGLTIDNPWGLRGRLVLAPSKHVYCHEDNVLELNQVRYVCRQIYLETLDLEKKLSRSLVIRPQWDNRPMPSGQLSLFCNGHTSRLSGV